MTDYEIVRGYELEFIALEDRYTAADKAEEYDSIEQIHLELSVLIDKVLNHEPRTRQTAALYRAIEGVIDNLLERHYGD